MVPEPESVYIALSIESPWPMLKSVVVDDVAGLASLRFIDS